MILIGSVFSRLSLALEQRPVLQPRTRTPGAERTAEIERLFEKTKELAVIEERNRLARDLHDSVKQKAFAAMAQLGTAQAILAQESGISQIPPGGSGNTGIRSDRGIDLPDPGNVPVGSQRKGLNVGAALLYL